ncbi:MAG: hypothetical protein CL679_10850 [Bermanella sp.]|nr:hypothetical protein [Bermanella sp.]|tara:strand:+ start:377 stop:1162 length:786 start_codon:yes stop_codon:yes gene_type:complete
MPFNNKASCLLASAFLTVGVMHANAADMDDAINKGVDRIGNAQQSQVKIDNVDDQTRQAERQYRAVVKEVEGLTVYINQLDKQLLAQDKELVQIEESIRQVTLIERQITPLMLRMIDAIDQFVESDIPFLKEERSKRVSKIKDMMARSDVTVAEKYRKVMEAYQTEIDYGRTIESYRGDVMIDGTEREVDFLRTGRISLAYQTLDGQSLGVWNAQSNQFEELDSSYKSKIMMGIRIAREQAAPQLIKVPVAAPVVVTAEAK